MLSKTSPLSDLVAYFASGKTTPQQIAVESTNLANSNASRNTYIHFDQVSLVEQANELSQRFQRAASKPPLFAVPISVKDCFDLSGTVTTCGTRFYAQLHPPATTDSAMAARLLAAGALITGKTHLHPLAYGITGQNTDYGDCLQPRDQTLLTGGSSSGAAASVQEGSALAAIGTDTGGSIRVPAALCGLAGYRASHSLAHASGPWPHTSEGLWAGAAHLAPAFDTPGFFTRDPRDLASIAQALFGVASTKVPNAPRIGLPDPSFLSDCDSDVTSAFEHWRSHFNRSGAQLVEIDTTPWTNSQDIFVGLQAHEAATIHRGYFDHFEASIAQRLHWGSSLTEADLDPLRQRLVDFRANLAELFTQLDFLVLPCAPVSRLVAAEDQSYARQRILRYTTPFSLAGLPAIALPGEIIGAPFGTGIQIAAAPGRDALLLAYASTLTQAIFDNQA